MTVATCCGIGRRAGFHPICWNIREQVRKGSSVSEKTILGFIPSQEGAWILQDNAPTARLSSGAQHGATMRIAKPLVHAISSNDASPTQACENAIVLKKPSAVSSRSGLQSPCIPGRAQGRITKRPSVMGYFVLGLAATGLGRAAEMTSPKALAPHAPHLDGEPPPQELSVQNPQTRHLLEKDPGTRVVEASRHPKPKSFRAQEELGLPFKSESQEKLLSYLISLSPYLTRALRKVRKTGEKFEWTDKLNPYRLPFKKQIALPGLFNVEEAEWNGPEFSNNQRAGMMIAALKDLAHEVGHALTPEALGFGSLGLEHFRTKADYVNAYVALAVRGEGDALYSELRVAEDLARYGINMPVLRNTHYEQSHLQKIFNDKALTKGEKRQMLGEIVRSAHDGFEGNYPVYAAQNWDRFIAAQRPIARLWHRLKTSLIKDELR
jgi:hypothetical protein